MAEKRQRGTKAKVVPASNDERNKGGKLQLADCRNVVALSATQQPAFCISKVTEVNSAYFYFHLAKSSDDMSGLTAALPKCPNATCFGYPSVKFRYYEELHSLTLFLSWCSFTREISVHLNQLVMVCFLQSVVPPLIAGNFYNTELHVSHPIQFLHPIVQAARHPHGFAVNMNLEASRFGKHAVQHIQIPEAELHLTCTMFFKGPFKMWNFTVAIFTLSSNCADLCCERQ
ncbi:hypothetical protein DAPPUDRAFT_120695 [Daphnia pulex]|uniref:Uncharacterized protein n=1 Tax=Daphnia pulex TaxID=6669 RepID=E9I208_DAPPU|nr:hypothetical protein DAPPUDRAFT_120695 [Daphnia pulex]|eukprot:EFX61973.1 hypothetical protein DAPPUDRAFT_120695 [Daphnia pulex]